MMGSIYDSLPTGDKDEVVEETSSLVRKWKKPREKKMDIPSCFDKSYFTKKLKEHRYNHDKFSQWQALANYAETVYEAYRGVMYHFYKSIDRLDTAPEYVRNIDSVLDMDILERAISAGDQELVKVLGNETGVKFKKDRHRTLYEIKKYGAYTHLMIHEMNEYEKKENHDYIHQMINLQRRWENVDDADEMSIVNMFASHIRAKYLIQNYLGNFFASKTWGGVLARRHVGSMKIYESRESTSLVKDLITNVGGYDIDNTEPELVEKLSLVGDDLHQRLIKLYRYYKDIKYIIAKLRISSDVKKVDDYTFMDYDDDSRRDIYDVASVYQKSCSDLLSKIPDGEQYDRCRGDIKYMVASLTDLLEKNKANHEEYLRIYKSFEED